MSHTVGLYYSETFKDRDDRRWQRWAEPDSFHGRPRSLDLALTSSSPLLPFWYPGDPGWSQIHDVFDERKSRPGGVITPSVLVGTVGLLQPILAAVW